MSFESGVRLPPLGWQYRVGKAIVVLVEGITLGYRAGFIEKVDWRGGGGDGLADCCLDPEATV